MFFVSRSILIIMHLQLHSYFSLPGVAFLPCEQNGTGKCIKLIAYAKMMRPDKQICSHEDFSQCTSDIFHVREFSNATEILRLLIDFFQFPCLTVLSLCAYVRQTKKRFLLLVTKKKTFPVRFSCRQSRITAVCMTATFKESLACLYHRLDFLRWVWTMMAAVPDPKLWKRRGLL